MEELEWQTAVLGGLRPDDFRLAAPVRSDRGDLVVGGWTASRFLEGRHQDGRWLEIIEVGRRMARAFADVPRPGFLDRRTSPWALADRMAWQEAPLGALAEVDHISRLAELRRPLRADSQIIHGDLAGNVLFGEGLSPAVIDFSPYWRPPAYTSAVVIGDAIVSEGAGTDLVSALEGGQDRGQYFVRAILFRAIVDAKIRPTEASKTMERAYRTAIDLARDIVAAG